MMGPALTWYLAIAAFLFAIGALGVMLRRSPLIVLLSLEIMLNGANLALISFSRHHGELDGQIFALAVMAVAASEVVVGLGLIVAVNRRKLELDVLQAEVEAFWKQGYIVLRGVFKREEMAVLKEIIVRHAGMSAHAAGRRPDLVRGFTVPALPVVAVLGIVVCGAMIYGLGWTNWLRLIVWLVIGLVFFFGYGRKHSRLEVQAQPAFR